MKHRGRKKLMVVPKCLSFPLALRWINVLNSINEGLN